MWFSRKIFQVGKISNILYEGQEGGFEETNIGHYQSYNFSG